MYIYIYDSDELQYACNVAYHLILDEIRHFKLLSAMNVD